MCELLLSCCISGFRSLHPGCDVGFA